MSVSLRARDQGPVVSSIRASGGVRSLSDPSRLAHDVSGSNSRIAQVVKGSLLLGLSYFGLMGSPSSGSSDTSRALTTFSPGNDWSLIPQATSHSSAGSVAANVLGTKSLSLHVGPLDLGLKKPTTSHESSSRSLLSPTNAENEISIPAPLSSDCLKSLALGLAGSLITGNGSPLLFSFMGCLPVAAAQGSSSGSGPGITITGTCLNPSVYGGLPVLVVNEVSVTGRTSKHGRLIDQAEVSTGLFNDPCVKFLCPSSCFVPIPPATVKSYSDGSIALNNNGSPLTDSDIANFFDCVSYQLTCSPIGTNRVTFALWDGPGLPHDPPEIAAYLDCYVVGPTKAPSPPPGPSGSGSGSGSTDSPAPSGPTPPPGPAPTSPNAPPSGGTNVPVIAGAAGGAVGLALIAGGVYYWKLKAARITEQTPGASYQTFPETRVNAETTRSGAEA